MAETEVKFERVANWIVGTQGAGAPSEASFAALIEALRGAGVRGFVFFARLDGRLTSKQREKMVNTLKTAKLRLAVISDSLTVRAVATALSWFYSHVQSVSSSKANDAFSFVGANEEQFEALREAIARLGGHLPTRQTR